LIADDDDNIRSLIDEILKTEHVPTTVCSSGLEALDLIKREDFGIIISDIKIRDFDGMGLLKAAKVINPNSDVIIIRVTPPWNRRDCHARERRDTYKTLRRGAVSQVGEPTHRETYSGAQAEGRKAPDGNSALR
jgi:CheY-like chemotaxis protein